MAFSTLRSEKYLQIGAAVLLGCGFLLLLFFVYFSFAPLTVAEYNDVRMLKKEYKAGERLLVHLEYCKKQKLPATVYPRIQGLSSVYFLPSFTSDMPKGCVRVDLDTLSVPTNAATGYYRLFVDEVYQVTTFRRVTNSFETDEFRVE